MQSATSSGKLRAVIRPRSIFDTIQPRRQDLGWMALSGSSACILAGSSLTPATLIVPRCQARTTPTLHVRLGNSPCHDATRRS